MLNRDYPIPLFSWLTYPGWALPITKLWMGQRLNAIFSFIDNVFKIDGKYFDINEFSRAKQAAESGTFLSADRKTNEFLSPSVCADILDYQLAVTIFPKETERQ